MKHKKIFIAGAIAICVAVVVVAVQFYGKDATDSTLNSEQIYSRKNANVGDASADIALLDALGIAAIGSHTIQLETSEKPFILRINFSELSTAYKAINFDIDMKTRAAILLALIGNVDEIHYYYPADDMQEMITIKSSDLQNQLGNIKDYGASLESFRSLLRRIKELGARGDWCDGAETCDPISFR